MKIQLSTARRLHRGFTLVEMMVAAGVLIVLFVGLYLGFAASFTVIQSARENLRATQILVQRMETARLYTWDQINSSAYIKPTFVDAYAPLGVTYHGRVTVGSTVPVGAASYASKMRKLTVSVTWTNASGPKIAQTRTMETLVGRFGMQNYIYGTTR
jgi:type II secretory pathway pseudopilin PulG